MTIHLSIERDLAAGPHKSGRFRCKLRAAKDGPNLFTSTRNAGSVSTAKRDAELLLGEIDWLEAPEGGTIRATAEVEFD